MLVGAPPEMTVRMRPVAGSRRTTLPLESAIQTEPAPTATPLGEAPTADGLRETWLVSGSTNNSRPVAALVTQMPPFPAASAEGVAPRGIVLMTLPAPGAILDSVLSVTFATQTDP